MNVWEITEKNQWDSWPSVGTAKLSFKAPIKKSGEPTLYFKIIYEIASNGIISKQEIWDNIYFEHGVIRSWKAQDHKNRPWLNNSLFDSMREANLIKAVRHHGKWVWILGSKYPEWIEWLMKEGKI